MVELTGPTERKMLINALNSGADRLLQLIAAEHVTFSHYVPTILHMLLNHPMAHPGLSQRPR